MILSIEHLNDIPIWFWLVAPAGVIAVVAVIYLLDDDVDIF